MDTNACRWCGTEIVDGVEKCATCGARVAPPRAESPANGAAGAPAEAAAIASPSLPAAAPLAAAPAWASPAAAVPAADDAPEVWAPPVQVSQTWASPVVAGASSDGPTAAAVAEPDAAQASVPQPPPPGLAVASPSQRTSAPPATDERKGTNPLAWVAVVLVAGFAVVAATRLMGGGLVSFPDTVLGQQKMSGPEVDAIVETLEDTRIAGQSFHAAFYGSATPTLMIVVAETSSLTDPEESWKGFGGGFASTSGSSIEQRAKQTAVIDGVNYICAPVAEMASTVCQWTDDRSTGYVFDYTVGDAKASITRTQSVYEVVLTG